MFPHNGVLLLFPVVVGSNFIPRILPLSLNSPEENSDSLLTKSGCQKFFIQVVSNSYKKFESAIESNTVFMVNLVELSIE